MDESTKAILKEMGLLDQVQQKLKNRTQPIPNDQVIQLWLESLNSEETKHIYKANLRRFLRFIENKNLLQVTRKDTESYFVYLNTNKTIGLARKQNLFATIQSFYKFIYDQHKFNDKIPAFENPLPETKKRWSREETGERSLKNVRLHIEEIQKLLQALKSINYRDYLAIYILADTGCRIGGLLNLKIENIHLEDRYFISREKNSGNNRYCFGKNLQAELAIYLDLIKNVQQSPYLFASQRGTKMIRDVISRRLKNQVYRLLGTSVTIHTFRRSFGTNRRLQGQAKDTIKRLLNHKMNDSTEAYMPVEQLQDFDAYETL